MGSNVWKLVLVTATREFVFISEAIPKPQHGLNRNANFAVKMHTTSPHPFPE
jgi:hypothetical protein